MLDNEKVYCSLRAEAIIDTSLWLQALLGAVGFHAVGHHTPTGCEFRVEVESGWLKTLQAALCLPVEENLTSAPEAKICVKRFLFGINGRNSVNIYNNKSNILYIVEHCSGKETQTWVEDDTYTREEQTNWAGKVNDNYESMAPGSKQSCCLCGGDACTGKLQPGFLHADYGGENYAHIKQKNAETPLTERKRRRKDKLFFPVASFSPAQWTAVMVRRSREL